MATSQYDKVGALRAPLLAAVALLFGTLLEGDRAGAFTAQGNKWPAGSIPVSYRLHPDGSADVNDNSEHEAIRRAFRSWEAVTCSSLRFREDPWMEPRVVNQDTVNRIFWVENMGEWPEAQRSTIAFTFTFFNTATKEITDADIIANGVFYQWTTDGTRAGGQTVDVETVFFHEMGHFFGLDHSTDPNAAMYPSNNKPVQRGPAPDDINGICSLYGNGQPAPGNTGQGGAVGAPCQAPENCASNVCVNDPLLNSAYCTQPCDAQQALSCPAGFQCTATQQGGYCLQPVPTDELCDECNQGNQCSSGLCITVPGYNNFRPFCSKACDPTPGQTQSCPAGYSCQQVEGQAGGACAPVNGVCDPRGKGGHNEPCYASGGCKAGHTCIEYYPGTPLRFCYFACGAQFIGLACSDTMRVQCLPVTGRDDAACFTIAAPGEPCIPEICSSNAECLMDDSGNVDSALCYLACDQTQCPANTQCTPIQGARPVCVPNAGFKFLGDLCQDDQECESRTCRTYGQNRLCTKVCTPSDPASCPRGLRCVPTANRTDGLCWPDTYTDSTAKDPTRTVTTRETPPGYCACDTTSTCDAACDCDPECKPGGCSCDAVAPGSPSRSSGSSGASEIVISLVSGLALLAARRRRRLGSARGRA